MKRNFQNSASNSSSIEQEITAFFNGIESNLKEGLVVEKARLSKGSTYCKGEINVYNAEDFKRMKEDKSFRAKSLERYTFYSNTLKPSRIGSIAIYGENAFNRCLSLNRRGFLFGKKILNAKVEQGRRPFVDVTLFV